MAIHKFLKAASVLPALLVMPAVAEDVAQVGGAGYKTLVEAIDAAQKLSADNTVNVLANIPDGSGVFVKPNSGNFNVDFANKTYNAVEPAVGSGNTTSQMFHMERGNVIGFRNGTLTVTDTPSGDKTQDFNMMIQNYSDLTLENMVLDGRNLQKPSSGGAYVVSHNNGIANIINSTILAAVGDIGLDVWHSKSYDDVVVNVKNSTIGGHIEVTTDGTDVGDEKHELNITDGELLANHWDTNGGKLFNQGNTILTDVEFEENSSGQNGGAIYNEGQIEISDSDFKQNSAASWGGAVYGTLGNVTVKDSLFEENTATTGGAIAVGTKNLDLIVQNSTFRNNSATGAGALALYSKNTLSGVKLTGNEATSADANPEGGGAILLGSESKTTIQKYVDEKNAVQKSLFMNNTSASFGGAIAMRTNDLGNHKAATLDITDAIFTSNNATTQGGAIFNTFHNNAAGDGHISIDKSIFTANTARDGGAIYNDGTGDLGNAIAAIKITDATFVDNIASANGGAIYNHLGDVILDGTNKFTGNKAAGNGNDIHNTGTLTIAGGTTTIDGGVTGTGNMTVADGATFDIGATTVTQDTFTLNGTLGATILDAKNYGNVVAKTLAFGENAAIKLTASTVGTYNLFGENATIGENVSLDAGALYNVERNGASFVLTTKSTDQVIAETGVSEIAAATLTSMAQNATGDIALVSARAQEELAAGNVDLVDGELAKAAPAAKPVAQAMTMSTQNQVMSLVASRVSAPAAPVMVGRNGGDWATPEFGVWAQGLVNKSKMNGQFDGDTRGVAAGIDTLIDGKWTLGAGYAYNKTDLNTTGRGDTDINSNTVFVYAQYKPSAWYINAAVNYTMSEYEDTYTMFGVALSNKHDVDAYGAQVMTGYDMVSGLTPEMGVRYLHISQDDYDNGFGRVKGGDTDFMTGIAGVKYSFEIESDNAAKFSPELRAAATYDFLSDASTATVTMPGAPAYVVDADRLSRFGGEFGVGLTMRYDALTLSVMYDLDLHQDYTSQTGMLKFRYDF